MKKILLISILFVFSIYSYGQVVNIQWEQSYGGSNLDWAQSIWQRPLDSGYVVVGPSSSNDSEVTGNHGSYDYWVVSLSPTGTILWEQSFGGSQDDVPYAVQQTGDGGYIVAGGTESTDGNVTGFIGDEYDYWLVKLSDTGSIQWETCYGGNNYNVAYSVQQVFGGSGPGYIVAGDSYSADTAEVTGHFGTLSGHGNADYWVIFLNSAGVLQWEKCYGGSLNDIGQCIRQTSDGGYIIAGQTSSTDGEVTGNHGGADYWVVKIDDTGALQWEKCLGGSSTDVAYSIQQTFDGGYIVAGESSSVDSQVTGNHGGYDYWVVKLNDSGGIQWERSYGGSGDDIAYWVRQTADSGYIVCGSSNSIDGDVTGNHGNTDYWVVKLSKYGNIQWEKSLGGSLEDNGFSIQQTLDNGYIVAGLSYSDDSEVTGNHGNSDFWVVKLSPCLLSANPVISVAGDVLSTTVPYTSYQWMLGGNPIAGATNATYTYPHPGQYSVYVTDSNTCSGSSISDSLNRVVNISNNSQVSIMPNPTKGAISVVGAGLVNIQVYNMIGMLMKEAEKTDNISISELPPGMYIVKLLDENGQMMLQDKIVKQ